MKTKIALVSVVLAWGMSAQAAIIEGTACTQPDNIFSNQVDCGTYLDTVAGNDAGGPLTVGTTSYDQLAKFEDGKWVESSSITGEVTGDGTDNGTWSLPSSIQFLVIKSGNEFSVYGQGALLSGIIGTVNGSLADVTAIFAGASSGFWATAPTLLGGDGLGSDLSHLSFYAYGTKVPEPGTLALLGLGLLGLGVARRRKSA